MRFSHALTAAGLSAIMVMGASCGGDASSETIVGTWSPTGSLTMGRQLHTATLLPSGKVLVAGGMDTGALTSAEVFDPAAGTWSPTGSLATPRAYHTATLLPNGKVLVAGGWDGSAFFAGAELYDPMTGMWGATGSLGTPRANYTATLLPSGKVLVAGGWDGITCLASAELYDPATETWSVTGSLTTRRQYHTATLLPNGKVLVAGGWSGPGWPGAELYDPVAGTWSVTGTLTIPREYHNATLLPNGKVLVAGGWNGWDGNVSLANTELYDPTYGTWIPTGSLGTARDATATLLPNGKVLVAGGWNNGLDGNASLASAELYDPAPETWSVTGSLATDRFNHTSTLLPNGKVLVAGGWNDSRASLASAELYDPAGVDGTPDGTQDFFAASCSHTAGGGWASIALPMLLLARRRRRVHVPVALLLCLFPCLALGQVVKPAVGDARTSPDDKRARVALLPVRTGIGIDAKLAEAAGDSFATALTHRGVSVVSLRDVEAALGLERQRQLLGCANEGSCFAEIGGALGVDLIVTGALARLGNRLVFTAQLLDARKATVLQRYEKRMNAAAEEEVLDAVDRAALELLPPGEIPIAEGARPTHLAPAPGSTPRTAFGIALRVSGSVTALGGAAALLADYRATPALRFSIGPAVTASGVPGVLARAAWVPVRFAKRFGIVLAAEGVGYSSHSSVVAGVAASAGLEAMLERGFALGLEVPALYLFAAPAEYRKLYVTPGMMVGWSF